MNQHSILELISEITQKNGNKSAVIFNHEQLSYYDLNERSDNLAKCLVNQGIKPGSIIALGLYNDPDVIVCLLAIWKANCIYLPIDPNYPFNRIDMMLKNACPSLLITKKELQLKFSFFEGETYFIDEVDKAPNIELKKPKLNDLAYLMYTSGSTGTPKGIIVDHRALKHAAVAYNELHPEKSIALIAGSISFDPSLLVIVSTLTKGGTFCLYDNRDGIDISRPQDIVDLIDKNLISFILAAPSFYSMLLQQDKVLFSLKNVDLCGEDISKTLVDSHMKNSPNATLYNVYGPTEYAMGVTASLIYDPKGKKTSPISIGKPFSSNKIYILNSDMNRTKIGENGEICIGGPGLACGYFKQETLTKEKFLVVDHLESDPIRIYRTGDIGYFLPTGEIVFIGRADRQIKINGHRVELDEVEKFISKHPQIEKVVTLVVQEKNTNRLVAFYSGKENISSNVLRDFLFPDLPPYMIPSIFIQINDWPLTNNGKVDKAALESLAYSTLESRIELINI